MITKIDSRKLAIDLCQRSSCNVKMAAVLSDKYGIFAWGWNHLGNTGYGTHAEEHAISRSNRARLKNATITVYGIRRKTPVFSRPCEQVCMPIIEKVGIKEIQFFDKHRWQRILL